MLPFFIMPDLEDISLRVDPGTRFVCPIELEGSKRVFYVFRWMWRENVIVFYVNAWYKALVSRYSDPTMNVAYLKKGLFWFNIGNLTILETTKKIKDFSQIFLLFTLAYHYFGIWNLIFSLKLQGMQRKIEIDNKILPISKDFFKFFCFFILFFDFWTHRPQI
jgi:hypothetical protein